MSLGLALKIGIPALLVIGIGFGVKRYSDTLEDLGAANQELATCRQSNAHQDEQIRALNERLKANNARWLEMLQREQDRFATARAEADRIKAERDTITAELAASRRDWQEAVRNDEYLAEFVAHPVPGAVWDRLRSAAGQ